MGAIAVLSAVLTATLVIGAGRALMPSGHEAVAADAPVVRTAQP